MRLTNHHAKYLAYELTKRCPSDSLEKLAGALVDAKVDLNPHQVEAALFAFRSPLSKGALLADEVGLGKTIEAGLVLSQKWAERKRKVLVITPANLRKQWHQEMQEKFFLPCRILEAKSYNQEVRAGNFAPFERFDAVTICSYQFAKSKAGDIHRVPWDLVVMDEAHRLRNVYKPSNVIANTLKRALGNAPKILLTATPLQNSLLELYGLVSFIDEHAFGDVGSFREQYTSLGDEGVFETLKARLKPLCHRTLRRQVAPFVKYTARHAMVEDFTPDEAEDRLYTLVSDYLRRPDLQALPARQRSLIVLVMRKLLASSSFAIAGALTTLTTRLKAKLERQSVGEPLEDELDRDYEALDETAEEWEDDGEEPMSADDLASLDREIRDLEEFRDLAASISTNAKGRALLKALDKAFAHADGHGAPRKAIIFTESRKTQQYLLRVLAESEHAGKTVLFNGSNTDPESRAVYERWLERHRGTDRVTGSRSADMRSALVEEFAEHACIMIATEAGAEGINLQFCSLVVNYDLPWNPQRIEQRIGRCHRYGQKHDVVVVNFVNQKNEADKRVFELLEQKFKLFEGVFGSSDEVLGAIESGVDFEKRIADIYQRCRTPEEITASFDRLQRDLSAEISEQMTRTRQQLLDNFDAEVTEKLRLKKLDAAECMSRYEQLLMRLTRHELGDRAEFVGDSSFRLQRNPFPDALADEVPLGLYELPRRDDSAHVYRLAHPLAVRLLDRAKGRALGRVELTLDCTNQTPAISALKPHVGRCGELTVTLLSMESLEHAEDHLIVAAAPDGGEPLDAAVARRLFDLCVLSERELDPAPTPSALQAWTRAREEEIREAQARRNAAAFEAEVFKLEGWADDLRVALERELKDLDRQIKEAKRAATAAATLEEKVSRQKEVKHLEQSRLAKRKSLFEAADEVDRRRGAMIKEVESKLDRQERSSLLLSLRWKVV